MNSPAAPITPSQAGTKPGTARRTGTDDVALIELRNAAATYDFLQGKGDPVQFWEALRLARNRRCLTAPAGGGTATPTPAVEADILKEVASVRRQMAPMVGTLRAFLSQVPGLPEPSDRLEFALAFLLVTPREHQAIAKWTDPRVHGEKAADKLKSLAAITDPYRDALQPWTLKPSTIAASDSTAADLDLLRRAMSCREIFDGLQLETSLWENLALLTRDAASAGPALERLIGELEGGQLEEFQTDAERLYGQLAALRSRFAKGVELLRAFLATVKLLPPDERAFEVALGLLLASRSSGPRLSAWLESPASGREGLAGELKPLLPKAVSLLKSLSADA
jgi:hypothetical protein